MISWTELQQALGERVKTAREAAGLSQNGLAGRMGALGFAWHQTTVSRTEQGERTPRLDEALVLAALLDFDLPDLAPSIAEAVVSARKEWDTALLDDTELREVVRDIAEHHPALITHAVRRLARAEETAR